MKCAICDSEKFTEVKTIKTAIIEGSLLYKDILIIKCDNCGHVCNQLSDIELQNLRQYYENEYSDNKYTPTAAQGPVNAFIEHLLALNFGKEPAPSEHYSLYHILEHCWNIENVMLFLKNNIKKNGTVSVNVPDYSRYDKYQTDKLPYLFLIKEHIHHFSPSGIIDLFKKHGFRIKQSKDSWIGILNGKARIPETEYLFQKKTDIKINGIYCYGVGKEFLYLIENNSSLKKRNISGLIDDTPVKEGKKVGDLVIHNSEIVSELTRDSEIIITAIYNAAEIREKLEDMGYKGIITELSGII